MKDADERVRLKAEAEAEFQIGKEEGHLVHECTFLLYEMWPHFPSHLFLPLHSSIIKCTGIHYSRRSEGGRDQTVILSSCTVQTSDLMSKSWKMVYEWWTCTCTLGSQRSQVMTFQRPCKQATNNKIYIAISNLIVRSLLRTGTGYTEVHVVAFL